jgi:cell shape-determining protein MreC
MFGDLNIFRFIVLVLIFVVSIIFLIVSSNVIVSWAQSAVKQTLSIRVDLNRERRAYIADKKMRDEFFMSQRRGTELL